MWWFAAAHANLLMLYRRMTAALAPDKPILDAGCGTGGLLAKIAREFPRNCVVGIDSDGEACARAAAKSRRPVCNGSVNAMPFAEGAFAAIFSADVLCHRDVDENEALAQFRRCLGPDGVLVLNLPAYRWMLSRHDAAVYNIRRYTRSGVVRLLHAAGFRVVYISYWNTVLFPMMVLARKLLPGGTAPTSDVTIYPTLVEDFCRTATGFERFLLRYGVRLPFGGSLAVLAAKDLVLPEPPMPDTAAFAAGVAPRCALSIVIPVYRGAASIGELVGALEQLQIAGSHEIVLVNDGSPDDSLAVCRSLLEHARVPITLVDLSRNYGEHNAVMAGLRQARGGHVITMDDDLQNPPEEVERLLAFAQQNGCDAVYTYYDEKQHALWRNLGSRFTNWVAGFVLEKPKGFYLSSFRCISSFVVQEITRYEGPFPYVDGLILQVTQNIARLRVRHLPRAVGRSNYTMRRLLRLWLSMFVNFSVMPLRLSTLSGFALSLFGAIGSLVAVVEALFFDPPAGWASLMAAVMLLSGVQLLILGIVGEYLGRLYLTANRKPQSVVRSVARADPRLTDTSADSGRSTLREPA